MSVTAVESKSAAGHPDTESGVRECLHCHLPFHSTPRRRDFCCSGCQFVHGLINDHGLEKYYDLQDGKGQPVPSLVFQPRDYGWLEELVTEAETGKETAALVLDLQGISCIGCVWLIEQLFEQWPGALGVSINSSLGQIRLRWTAGECDVTGFAKKLQEFGYLLAPAVKRENRESRLLVRRMGITAALAMNCMLFTVPFYFGMDPGYEYAPLFSLVTFLLATASLVYGGSYFIKRSVQSLRRGIIHIDLPISIGVVAAYAGSTFAWWRHDHSFIYFDFVTVFIFLMLVGRWTQQLAIERNRNYLLGLQNQRQEVRLVIPGEEEGKRRKLPVTEVRGGMRYLVEPGQFIPVASELLSAEAVFGLEWINGESEPRNCRRSHRVPAGAVHLGAGAIELRADEDWADSLLASLLAMDVRETPRHPLLERIIKTYLLVVLAVAAAGFGAWFWATGNSLTALQVMISVLVVSCPCAIGVAWPLVDELAVSRLRKKGVFVRDQSLWGRLGRVRKIIFDKTGTLTLENLALANPAVMDRLNGHQRRVLLTMVQSTLHPVSRCLREILLANGVRPLDDDSQSAAARETVGTGLEMETGGDVWRLGRPDWQTPLTAPDAGHQGDCLFTLNGKTLAAFRFAEDIRADARSEISRWLGKGWSIFILSGDRKAKVAKMADHLGLARDHCHGELSPVDKADWIKANDRDDTLMIGDGANDSLAFDATWCRGTPAVDRGLLEQKSDFYFLGRGLNGIRHLFETAEDRGKTLTRVFLFTIAYNVFAVTLCLAGLMNPLVAAVIMPLSSIISISSVMMQSRWRESRRRRAEPLPGTPLEPEWYPQT